MKYYTILFILFFSGYLLANDNSKNQLKEEAHDSNKVDISSISLETLRAYMAKIDSISEASKKTAINTEPTLLSTTDWDEYLNISLALIAAVATFLAVWSIRLDTKQNSINKVMQEQILKDLIRHFYRNLVVLGAIRLKLEGQYSSYYPSEEHILKLKVLPEDVKIDRFTSTPEHYQILHMFELQLRNFDIEVDVAMVHLKNKNISHDVKLRDLDNLVFKCGHLSDFVLKLLKALQFDFNSYECVNVFLTKIHLDNVEGKEKNNNIEQIYKEKDEELKKLKIDLMTKKEKERLKFYDNLSVAILDNLCKDTVLEYKGVNIIEY